MDWRKLLTRDQDTGTLDITTLATGMTAGTWTLRRVGKFVQMALSDARFTPESGDIWNAYRFVPNGFRPPATPSYIYFPAMEARASDSGAGLRVSRYGDVNVYDVTDKRTSAICTWVTDDEWPATYPGVKL